MDLYKEMKLWLESKAVRGVLVLVVFAIAAFMAISNRNATVEEALEAPLPVVSVTTAQQYAGASTINLIGTVRAFSEAAITSEAAGRVTSVRVGLGDTVAAGTIIATLENASEQASVLSAQGVYEAALANTAQSTVSLETARNNLAAANNNALSNYKGAYNTANGVVLNNIDQFFRNPSGYYPSLRVGGKGNTQTILSLRIALQPILENWRTKANTVNDTDSISELLMQAESDLDQIIQLLDLLTDSVSEADDSDQLDGQSVRSFAPQLVAARSSLNTLSNSLQSSQTAITNSERSVTQAQLATSGGSNSAADAQVKQALGSLRSAQANLAKTIIRTPIGGTVNSLNIRTGDFINSFVQVAQVANNNALEVVTFAGAKDREVIAIGDTVQLDGRVAGVVTQIAPAVDSATGKTEVRIASESEDLQNGDSVNITKQVAESVTTDVIIPLGAVKFALTDGSVFVVVDGRLVDRPVTLGTIRGGTVEIIDGLTVDEQFVVDARGLVAGTEVEITK